MANTDKPKNLLWPHNKKAVEIDVEYFHNLPEVKYIPGQQEYVRMYFWYPGEEAMKNRDSIITLMTDRFKTEEEAWHFAKAFERHNYGIVEVEDNIVYGKTHVYSVLSNFRVNKSSYFEFPNWA